MLPPTLLLQVAEMQTRRSKKPDGSEGTFAETPFHLGPAKQLPSSDGALPQLAWDVALHPATIAAACTSPSIMAMITDAVSSGHVGWKR